MNLIFLKNLSMGLFLLSLSACVSKPVARDQAGQKGQWDTKAQLKDFKNQKNHSMSISFWSIQPDRMRAEVTGPFGVAVATLTLFRSHYDLAIHTQKKFYSGTASEQSLAKLLGVKLDPRILIYVLFDLALPESAWVCQRDAGNLLKECRGKSNEMSVKWSDRDGELKRITLAKTDFELQILVKDFSTNVQDEDGFFRQKAAPSYTSYQTP